MEVAEEEGGRGGCGEEGKEGRGVGDAQSAVVVGIS